MTTLTLASHEKAMAAAFERWLDQNPTDFTMELEGHTVTVTVVLDSSKRRFNCGTPGYNMVNKDIPALAKWVPNNIRINGSTGRLLPCKDQKVNAVLDAAVKFNYHVFLTKPCS